MYKSPHHRPGRLISCGALPDHVEPISSLSHPRRVGEGIFVRGSVSKRQDGQKHIWSRLVSSKKDQADQIDEIDQINKTNQIDGTDQPDQMNEINQTNQLNLQPSWYAPRTKLRHEKLVRDRLTSQGIEPLLPTVKRLSQWKDRRKEVEAPLFSCHCFVRFAPSVKDSVLKVTGESGNLGVVCPLVSRSIGLLPYCRFGAIVQSYIGNIWR